MRNLNIVKLPGRTCKHMCARSLLPPQYFRGGAQATRHHERSNTWGVPTHTLPVQGWTLLPTLLLEQGLTLRTPPDTRSYPIPPLCLCVCVFARSLEGRKAGKRAERTTQTRRLTWQTQTDFFLPAFLQIWRTTPASSSGLTYVRSRARLHDAMAAHP
jgi:hypothetical protein